MDRGQGVNGGQDPPRGARELHVGVFMRIVGKLWSDPGGLPERCFLKPVVRQPFGGEGSFALNELAKSVPSGDPRARRARWA